MYTSYDFPVLAESDDRWYVCERNPKTGRFRHIIHTGFPSKQQAEQERDSMLEIINGEEETNN